MNGTEGLTISDWVNDTLVGDAALQGLLGGSPGAAALRVNESVAPESTTYPHLVFTVGPEGRVVGTVTAEVMARFTVLVKVIGQGPSYGGLVPIYQRVHTLLANRLGITTALGIILTSVRTSVIQYPERDQGIEYRHLGGLYEINVQ